jgi:endonuclease/exonuclease/phosphatase family metal-dependent hydrolase
VRRKDALATAGVGSILTSTSVNPHQPIDGIFVDPTITVRTARVLDQPDTRIASDHLPILVELEIPSNLD